MSKPLFRFNVMMIIPIAGWCYLLVGLWLPLPHPLLEALWWLDLFLSVVVHVMQCPVALRVGRANGVSGMRSCSYTLMLGATWWRPLQTQMTRQQRDNDCVAKVAV